MKSASSERAEAVRVDDFRDDESDTLREGAPFGRTGMDSGRMPQ